MNERACDLYDFVEGKRLCLMHLPCFITLLIALCSTTLHAQTEVKSKSVYLELAGSGGLGSVNYEQDFYLFEKGALAWRAGLSLAPIDKNNGVGLVFPLMLHAKLGSGSSQVDAGIGQGVTVTTNGAFFSLTTAEIGYRYQKTQSPWFFRAAYTPLISYIVDFQVQHWGGLSIGYTLNATTK